MNISIFDVIYERYKIKKPLRLIELFAGIGSQSKALKRLGVDFEHYRVVEFDKYAIDSYNAIHETNFQTSDITKISAKDLAIVETDKYDYIMTYSFPCQDLSLAGKQKGMTKGDNTRSGLLWEVERLLDECKELPQILLMENVPQVVGANNAKDFNKWQNKLEQLGYKNYTNMLNAKDYNIPQNRKRCFMISVLGNYYYEFPRKQKLKLRLKDMLEDDVDEKYYLSDKMVEYITASNEKWTGNNDKAIINKSIANTINTGEGNRRCDASNYICKDLPDNTNIKLQQVGNLDIKGNDNIKRVYNPNGLSPTLTTMGGGNRQPKIQVNVLGNYSKSNHEASRIVDINGIAPTVMENHGTVTAIELKDTRNLKEKLADDLIESGAVKGGEVINHSYATSRTTNRTPIETTDGISPTLTTRPDTLGVVVGEHRRDEGIRTFKNNLMGTIRAKDSGGDKVVIKNNDLIPKVIGGIGEKKSNGGTQFYQQDRVYSGDGIALAHLASLPRGSYNYQINNLSIRKLTPKECWRLMGFDDEDFNKASKVNSNSQLYKQAGNSIVVNVLEAIFEELF